MDKPKAGSQNGLSFKSAGSGVPVEAPEKEKFEERKAEVQPEKEEIAPEKKEEEKPEPKEQKKDESGNPDEQKKLSSYFEEKKEDKPLRSESAFAMKEGDFEKEGNKTVIHAKHLHDDFMGFLNDPSQWFKIKNNKEKAEWLTSQFDVKLPNGEPDVARMESIVRNFLTETDKQKSYEHVKNNFPSWAWDSNVELPFEYRESPGKKEPDKMSEDIPFAEIELRDVMKIEAEKREIKLDEAWESESVFKYIVDNKYDPKTGALKPLSSLIGEALEKNAFATPPEKKPLGNAGNPDGGLPDEKKKAGPTLKRRKPGERPDWYS